MAIKKKTIITLLVLASSVLLLVVFALNPIFSRIKEESQNLVIQKNKVVESEVKIKNIQDFRINFKKYQTNLEKIEGLFINSSEPIEFIEFLESEAVNSRLFIKINPPVATKGSEGDVWPALEWSFDLNGSFPDFLSFLDRLESSPHLIKVVNLSIRSDPKIKNADAIAAALSIKTYAR